jgi:hypothetical protein
MANISNPAVAELLDQARSNSQRAHDEALDASADMALAEETADVAAARLRDAREWAQRAEAAVASGVPGAVEHAAEARRRVETAEHNANAARARHDATKQRHASAAAAHLAAHNLAAAAQRNAYAGYSEPVADGSW